MEKTKVNVEMVVYGDEFNADIISEALDLQATLQWRKGDAVKGRNIIRDHSSWSVEVGCEESDDISEQYAKLINIFYDRKEKLIQVTNRLDAKTLILITIFVYDEYRPIMTFNQDLINFANIIGAEIDIDMYLYEN